MTFAHALKTFPELTTQHLRLRQIRLDDAPAYFKELTRLPHVSAWSDGYATQSLEHSRLAIRSRLGSYTRGKTVVPWAIESGKKKLIGYIELCGIQNRSNAELAYWMSDSHTGRGLMTEAVVRVLDFAFDDLSLHRVYATAHCDNVASQRVLTKAGFSREGVLRLHGRLAGKWCDSLIFGILAADPRPRHGGPGA